MLLRSICSGILDLMKELIGTYINLSVHLYVAFLNLELNVIFRKFDNKTEWVKIETFAI